MVEITNGIFTGNDYDYYLIEDKSEWAILHCCKDPFHREFVGNVRKLRQSDPNYAFCIRGNEMALNLIDINYFDKRYLDFNKNMFEEAFKFLDSFREQGKNILIHCNQGESRGPSLCMLYIAYLGVFKSNVFDDVYDEFITLYPLYKPKENIYQNIRRLWGYFVFKERNI